MWEYGRYLASVGHVVTFVASRFDGAPREESIDGITVVRLGGIWSLWLRTFLYYMRQCRGRFDVVIAEGFGGSRIPRFSPLYVKEPIITEWHQVHDALFVEQYPRALVPALKLLERVTAFVHRDTVVRAGTVEWQRALTTVGFRPEKVALVPVSIREEWLTKPSTGARPPRIIWLGRFLRYKCPDDAVLAMKTVLKSVPSATLILAGRHTQPKYEQELIRLVDDLELNDSVEFRWDITEEEKRNLLKSCRVMVLPSSVEGFGIVVLEANACGVPVVASDGVPEGAVRHGFNGLRYPFGNIEQLSASLVMILRDDELHARLSNQAVEFASNFSWRRVSAGYEEVVQQVVAEARGA